MTRTRGLFRPEFLDRLATPSRFLSSELENVEGWSYVSRKFRRNSPAFASGHTFQTAGRDKIRAGFS